MAVFLSMLKGFASSFYRFRFGERRVFKVWFYRIGSAGFYE